MSLDPHWYSTIFGIYCYAGGGLAFIAVWTLICLWFRDNNILSNTIRVEHYHDLGKWMFAMVDLLGLHCLLAVPADLVRQPAGRDDLVS